MQSDNVVEKQPAWTESTARQYNEKCTNTQRAVWRKRGSVSPESLCEFGSFAPVRTAV